MIKEFFDENEVEYEEIPQSFFLALWARKLKTADFLWNAFWKSIAYVLFGTPALVVVYIFMRETLGESLNDGGTFMKGIPFVMATTLFLAILIMLIMNKKKTNAKYRNRQYFRVSKDYAQYIDGLPLPMFSKYAAKLADCANNESYILIVLEGTSEEDSTFLLFPWSVYEYENVKKPVYFSKKWYWFNIQKSKEEIVQEKINRICEPAMKKIFVKAVRK